VSMKRASMRPPAMSITIEPATASDVTMAG
jgi:hypothetical protein